MRDPVVNHTGFGRHRRMVRRGARSDPGFAATGAPSALIGPTDLSFALGVPGKMEDPTLVAAIEKTLAACIARKVIPAIHTNDTGMTAHWARRGMRLVSINSEAGLLVAGAAQAIKTIREATV